MLPGTTLIVPGGGGSSDGSGKRASGSNATPQGLVAVKAVYDRNAIETNIQRGNIGRPVFPRSGAKDEMDVIAGEFAVQEKKARSIETEDADTIHFLTSLTSCGADATANFPYDEEFQRISIMNRLRYVGVTRDYVSYSDPAKRKFMALQVAGISSHFADCDVPPGTLAELVVPLPSERKSDTKPKRPNVPDSKVVLEVRPYNPKTIESKVMAHLRAYTDNPQKYKNAMGIKIRTTDSWESFCNTMAMSPIMSFALIWNHLVKLGILNNSSFNQDSPFNLAHDRDLNTHDTILAMMAAFGYLEGVNMNGLSSKGINIKKEDRVKYERLKLELSKVVNYDLRVAQLSFSYSEEERADLGTDRKKGNILQSTPEGRMLYLQYNHTRFLVGALSDAIRRDQEWLIGKIVKGASAGQKFDLIQ